jgi:osmotically-inducible protein OsmY
MRNVQKLLIDIPSTINRGKSLMATATKAKAMTDAELREAIQDELCWEPSFDDREIGVSVKDGVATLTGTVRDIARAAAEALAWNVALPADRIKVSVSDAWITLTGEVDWGYQKAAAEASVRRLLGVKGVSNEVSIKPRAVQADIKARIEAAFRRSAAVDAQRIRVEAKGGEVTLRGNARTWFERDEAERSAWSAHGVTSVENLISLTPAAS